MAKILYPQVITEDLDDLKELEKYHRYTHLFQRVRMLGLLKSDEFLRERHGIQYAHPDGVGQLLRRHKIKLKTGRPRHEEADPEEQDAFKKTSRARSRR